MFGALWTLCLTELKILRRDRSAAMMAIILPLAMGISFGFAFADLEAPDGSEPAAGVVLGVWPAIAMQIAIMMGFTVYVRTTILFATRRQDFFLKRLRSTELSDAAIIGGMILPAVLIGVVQVVIVAIATFAAASSFPELPLLLATAIALSVPLFAGAGILTAAFTQSSENAQITTAIPLFVILGCMIWLAFTPVPATTLQLAVPGGGIAELVRLSWTTDLPAAELWSAAAKAAGATILWSALTIGLAHRYFRWEPR